MAFVLDFIQINLTWKLLLWSSVSMLRMTELRELEVFSSVRIGQREICGNYNVVELMLHINFEYVELRKFVFQC